MIAAKIRNMHPIYRPSRFLRNSGSNPQRAKLGEENGSFSFGSPATATYGLKKETYISRVSGSSLLTYTMDKGFGFDHIV